jgi:hypothetical protein
MLLETLETNMGKENISKERKYLLSLEDDGKLTMSGLAGVDGVRGADTGEFGKGDFCERFPFTPGYDLHINQVYLTIINSQPTPVIYPYTPCAKIAFIIVVKDAAGIAAKVKPANARHFLLEGINLVKTIVVVRIANVLAQIGVSDSCRTRSKPTQ